MRLPPCSASFPTYLPLSARPVVVSSAIGASPPWMLKLSDTGPSVKLAAAGPYARSLSRTVYVPGAVISEKSNHQTLSPDELSVAPPFHATGAPFLTDLPVALSTTEYFVSGVKVAEVS